MRLAHYYSPRRCLHARDLPTLRACLAAPLPPLQAAGLTPTFEQLQRFRRAGFPADGPARPPPFAELLRSFERGARVDGAFFCCSLEAAQHGQRGVLAVP